MQELVDSFKVARPTVLDFATHAANGRGENRDESVDEGPVSKKRKLEVSETEAEVLSGNHHTDRGIRTRSQSRKSTNPSLQEEPVVIEDSADENTEPGRLYYIQSTTWPIPFKTC